MGVVMKTEENKAVYSIWRAWQWNSTNTDINRIIFTFKSLRLL